MITIQNLTKIYPGNKVALKALNLQITTGIVGLVGPNGAGKTTLMRILATLLQPTSGIVQIFDHDLNTLHGKQHIRSLLGYLPQETGLHKQLTVEQELDYFAILKNITNASERKKQINESIAHVGLEREQKIQVHKLSGGMKRRLGIAIALLGNPDLIIVDEPTAGLDPVERIRFRNLLFEMAEKRLIILSTHIIADVSQMCTDLVVLHEGKLLFHEKPNQLLVQFTENFWQFTQQKGEASAIFPIHSSAQTTNRSTIPSGDCSQTSPTLEDAYLWLLQNHRTVSG